MHGDKQLFVDHRNFLPLAAHTSEPILEIGNDADGLL